MQAGFSRHRLSTGFWVEAVTKFAVQRLAKHLDRYQRFHPEDGQQVRINPTARRHIPEVTSVRTASLSSLGFVQIMLLDLNYEFYNSFIPHCDQISSGTDATAVSWRSVGDLLQH